MTLFFRNVGNSEVIVDAVFIGGVAQTSASTATLPVLGPAVTVSFTPAGTYTSGVSYTLTVITRTGGVFSYAVICGGSG